MEINAAAIVLWIFYQMLGLDAFRIGNMVSMKNLESDMKHMQMPNAYAHKRTAIFNKKPKRFFEYNPVAFRHESIDIEDETMKRPLFHFSPFITSIHSIKKHQRHQNTSPSDFRSDYIKPGGRPKHIKPYVDHFSGVKSFALHLKNRLRENGLDENYHPENKKISERPLGDIPLKEFLKSNHVEEFGESSCLPLLDYKPFNTEKNRNSVSLHLNNINETEKDNRFNLVYYQKSDSSTLGGNVPFPSQLNENKDSGLFWFDPESNAQKQVEYNFGRKQVQDLAVANKFILPKGEGNMPLDRLKNGKGTASSLENVLFPNPINAENDDIKFGKVYDITSGQNPIGYFEDDIDTSPGNNGYSRIGFDHFNINDQSVSSPVESLDLQFYDPSVDRLYPKTNVLDIQGEKGSTIDNHAYADQLFAGLGGFAEPNVHSIDNTDVGFGDFVDRDSKPFFGVEPQLDDGFQLLEQGFGSFNYDTDDCDIIDTKVCMENTDCSCYGLYQCKGNKCVINGNSDYDSQESPVGQWHEDPVDFDSWKK